MAWFSPRGWAGVWALAAAVCLAGCATTRGITVMGEDGKVRVVTPEEVAEMSGADTPYLLQVGDQIALSFKTRTLRAGESVWAYRIEVGDSMEVRFSPRFRDPEKYLIDVGDVIGVSFFKNWPLNVIRTVRPDGKISVAEVGDVQAAGLTPPQLKARLTELYAATGLIEGDPQITVNVDFVNLDRLEGMSRDVTVRPDGKIRLPMFNDDVLVAGLTVAEACSAIEEMASRTLRNRPHVAIMVFPGINPTLAAMDGVVTVRADGKIAVPRLGEAQAAGFTLEEVTTRLAEACQQVVFNPIEVSANLVEMTGSRIYVGGEVAMPGVYPLASTPTALQAVILARGALDTGRLNSVLVVRRNPNGKPFVFKTNLREALRLGSTENDLSLRPFDIVYVPKKPVAKANLFVDQYIDRMVPFDNTLGVNATYYLNEQKVDTKSRSVNYGVTVVPNVGLLP